MRKLYLLSIALAALLLAGCIPTLNPLFTEDDLLFDDDLLIGEWVREGREAIWTISRDPANPFYEVTTREGDKVLSYEMRLLRFGGEMYLDLIPKPWRAASHSIYDDHFVPMHMFYRIDTLEPKLMFRGIEPKWLIDHLAENPDAIAFRKIHDTVLLTAETADLQAFLGEIHDAEGAFTNAFVFVKQSATAFARGSDQAISATARPRLDFPPVGPYEVLIGDFHIHTTRSDGRLEPRARVLEAWAYGYDAIAITDHHNYDAYAEVDDYARSLGLILLQGLESGIHGREHYVIVGISDHYEPRNPHSWAERRGEETVFYQDQLRRVEAEGGLVIWAHPHTGFREPTRWGIRQDIIQGVEVKNLVVGSGWGTQESHGTWCYPNAFDWALENNLAIFANSDIHAPRGETPQPVTLVFARERSVEGVMNAFRDRGTIAWFDGMLWGREAILSDLIEATVRATRVDEAGGKSLIQLENLGPVPLTAVLKTAEGGSYGSITLDGYARMMLESQNPPDAFHVEWENVWITPRDNLSGTLVLEAR